jgi:hypothetical protein
MISSGYHRKLIQKIKIRTGLNTLDYTKKKYCSLHCQRLKEGALHFALGFHFSVCFGLPKFKPKICIVVFFW